MLRADMAGLLPRPRRDDEVRNFRLRKIPSECDGKELLVAPLEIRDDQLGCLQIRRRSRVVLKQPLALRCVALEPFKHRAIIVETKLVELYYAH